MNPSVKIVIPVYRPFTAQEEWSVNRAVSLLNRYPICVVIPSDLDRVYFETRIPGATVIPVSSEWLGPKNGIHGYNRMMMSESFYDLFADTDYILIYHPDAWIFRDELDRWCRTGYDCIAAPWIRRRVYDYPFVRLYSGFVQFMARLRRKPTRRQLYGKVGNGGLSLRRVKAFREACVRYRATIEEYLRQRDHLHNEDVFWATVPQEFRYPTQEEALRFAYDTHPRYCYKMMGKTLPFGCHGWTKPRYNKFWKRFIPSGED